MADDDIRELYLIPVERRADCLVCADDTLPLLTMILGDTVTLCSRHLVELTRRIDAADGSHISLADAPAPEPRVIEHPGRWERER